MCLTFTYIPTDPKITVVPELRWLSGEFAMPRPQRGCPEGFSWGNLTQDTTNTFHDNSWSDGIANHLLVNVKADKITTSFCVKTSEHASFNEPHYELPWPSGSYCIGRRNGFCPDGFGMGFIQWDDKDIFNENSHSGELPDGKYGKDTKIFFCCRSDAETSVAMTMPTARPFILYRHGGACQIVAGMKVKEDYIEWISNTHKLLFNKNAVYGLHPDDDGGKRRYRLHYCHYSAKD